MKLNPLLALPFLKEWIDFFDDKTFNDISSTINQTNDRTILSNYENAYVCDCIFEDISSKTGDGGVIYYSKTQNFLLNILLLTHAVVRVMEVPFTFMMKVNVFFLLFVE